MGRAFILVLTVALGSLCAAGALSDDEFVRWRPGQQISGMRYVGSAACAKCHAEQAATFFASPMAGAALAPADSSILSSRVPLKFRDGPYTFEIARRAGRFVYSVSNGTATISEPIVSCFGRGVSGQTFLFSHAGSLYESRVSYFEGLHGLGITILHPRAAPPTLEEAIGRRLSADAAKGCYGCHSTAAAGSDTFEVATSTPGVGCESCHGPGERHVAAMKVKDVQHSAIFDPRTLDAIDMSQEFCGACHMSFDKVMLKTDPNPFETIRFQPYRLFKSASHVVPDARMSCTACHDPHGSTSSNARSYDAKCLACHLTKVGDAPAASRTDPACPKAQSECVTCHMPKVELPEMHAPFTDHYIRVVRAGEAVPG